MSRHNKKLNRLLSQTRKTEYEHIVLKKLLKYAKQNRKTWTPWESRLNGWLSNWGIRHTNQAVMSPYIADILLEDVRMIIELDGSQHELNPEYDKRRDEFLQSQGYQVLRIKNSEMQDRQKVKEKIFKEINLLNPVIPL